MNNRRCLTCQTMRPEDKMIRKGPDWFCKNTKNCQKGVQIRKNDIEMIRIRDYSYGRGREAELQGDRGGPAGIR